MILWPRSLVCPIWKPLLINCIANPLRIPSYTHYCFYSFFGEISVFAPATSWYQWLSISLKLEVQWHTINNHCHNFITWLIGVWWVIPCYTLISDDIIRNNPKLPGHPSDTTGLCQRMTVAAGSSILALWVSRDAAVAAMTRSAYAAPSENSAKCGRSIQPV